LIQKSEADIMKNWQGDFFHPVVSICSITYNHENFIEEALDSFLMQETDFPFEIIIDDDFSEDNTAKIIRKYEKTFPKIIKANLRRKNVGMIENHIDNTQRAQGKYIALCEGDDYWINPLKIQKQVDFLGNNENFSFCFHDYDVWDEMEQTYRRNASIHHFNFPINSVYSSTRILLGPFIASALTLMYKNILDRPKCLNSLPFGDKSLEKLLAFYGDGYFMNDSMSCYRNHNAGISKNIKWKELMANQEEINLELYECLKKSFSTQHIAVMNCRISYHKMLRERSKNEFKFFATIGKEIKVTLVYVNLSRDTLLDKVLLEILLLSQLYCPLSISKWSKKVYYKIYKLILY